MRTWIGTLVFGLLLGCSGGGAKDDGGAGNRGRGGSASGGAGVSGRGGNGGASGNDGTSGNGGASGNGGTSGNGGASGSGVLIDGGSSDCELLAGLSFDSIDERECGLAPPDSGAALCRWRISFTNSTTFTWHHSDYVESGTYTCSANTITAQTVARGSLTATLDLWRFTWDGVVYICNGCPP
jgi:hypothetical protein